jgi:DNA-directed RNA polymerase specialized sigma24 family protein
MAVVLLHLVNEHGQPVPPSVRVAVETAYHWVLREYEHFDQALLAGMAESVALAMCRRLVQIEFPRRYAIVALTGKLQEWYRAHPGVEVSLELEESERIKGPRPGAMTSADLGILFAEIKVQLSERDRQILVLMEQDLGGPQQIAEVFEMSYSAAAKAIQRVRDRMAAILAPSETRNGSDNEMMTRSQHFNPDI